MKLFMMVFANSYGPSKKIPQPKEASYIIGYTAKDGKDYIAIKPDFEKEGWVNDLIQEVGLETLCQEFPYQPLVVDKDTAMLKPLLSSDYSAKITNIFHVIYHMRKDEMDRQQSTQMSPISSYIEKPSITIQPSNFILNSDSTIDQNGGYTPNWSEAYHHETEIPQIHETQVSNFIESAEDIAKKHGMTNVDITISQDQAFGKIPKGWHPNENVGYNAQYGYGYNPALSYMGQQQPMMSQNPYAYNPQSTSSYLPQYKSKSQYPFMSMDTVEEEFARMQDREKANMEYATRMNMNIRSSNPTFLDTSNTVDFSNPESVARMQGMYTNPYYNNLNNPNFAAPNNYQYGLSNPYQQTVNPVYANQYQYTPQYGGYTNWWGGVDLSFMEFSNEELKKGKGFKVRLVRKSEEEIRRDKETEQKISFGPKKKKEFKVRLRRVVEVVKDGKVVQIDEDEYEKQKMEAQKTEQNSTIEEKLSSIDREVSNHKWYGESYKDQVSKLANELAVYDEARALCLIGSLDDDSITKHEFRLYYEACEDKLKWFKSQEEIHPEKDYRVPFRYRKLPVEIPAIKGYKAFQPYTIPMRRKFTLPDGKVIPFYEYDRGREPNDAEWQVFYQQAEYERDKDIKLMQAKKIDDYAKEQQELNKFNPYNMMDVRLHEMRMEDKLKKDQYDIYRSAYGASISDEQFDKWWYKCNPASMPADRPRTEEDLIEQRKQWRANMGMQHMAMLQNIVPIDPEKVRQYKTNKINEIIRDFDKDTMKDCHSLRDFFDRLGYLRVRVSEENIARQRAEDLNASMTVNRYDYTRNLYAMAQPSNWGNQGVNDPYFQNRPHYMDFVNSRDYEEKKAQFFNYCSNTQGTIPLRPIYK